MNFRSGSGGQQTNPKKRRTKGYVYGGAIGTSLSSGQNLPYLQPRLGMAVLRGAPENCAVLSEGNVQTVSQ